MHTDHIETATGAATDPRIRKTALHSAWAGLLGRLRQRGLALLSLCLLVLGCSQGQSTEDSAVTAKSPHRAPLKQGALWLLKMIS